MYGFETPEHYPKWAVLPGVIDATCDMAKLPIFGVFTLSCLDAAHTK